MAKKLLKMNLSLNWLKEFVKTKETPEKIAEVLTLGGFEVEKITACGQGLEHVVVGQIKTIVNHAEADRLSVCKVDIGKKELLKIVCGARNIKPGQHVPVALVGAKLPNGLVIERRKIRGIESEGMLCAPDELGLGEDHSGIMILAKEMRIGQAFGKATGLDDTVLDVSVTPNRPDCFSVIGLAREYAALSGQKFIEKKIKLQESKKFKIKKLLAVKIHDHDLCPKYTVRVVKNVKIRQSPEWFKSRLTVVGIKPINNIVDITNFVMLEYGQPLHAFDLAKLKSKKIVVRKAAQDNKFSTLDGEHRHLEPDMLVIADAKEPIAVAGVMGGLNSEISKGTKDVVIESAIFKPISIRKTRQKLGLVTEASARFEKGIWWGLPEQAADRAAQLMAELAGGEVVNGIISESQGKNQKPAVIKVSLKYLNGLIGDNFTLSVVKQYLERLWFKVSSSGKDEIKVEAPAWRQDVGIPADIAEEIGRMYGWNKVKPQPIYAQLKPVALSPEKYWDREIGNVLMACGLTEMINYPFYSQNLLEQFSLEIRAHYRVTNPLNPEQEYMRTSLLPELYVNLLKNYQSRESVRIFEIGAVYIKGQGTMPEERKRLAGVIYHAGKRKGEDDSLAEVKRALNEIFQKLNIPAEKINFTAKDDLVNSGSVMIGRESIGYFGLLTVGAQKFTSLPAWFEINLPKLFSHAVINNKYRSITVFPAIERDLTFRAKPELEYGEIIQAISQLDKLIQSAVGIKFFKEADNSLSITLRVICQAPDRTLKSEEVEAVEKKIIGELKNKFMIEIKK